MQHCYMLWGGVNCVYVGRGGGLANQLLWCKYNKKNSKDNLHHSHIMHSLRNKFVSNKAIILNISAFLNHDHDNSFDTQ